MDTEKIILLSWVWCIVRLVFFDTYDIVFLPTILILLDQFFTPSNKIPSSEDKSGSRALGIAAQEDANTIQKKKCRIQGKEEKHLNGLISKLMNEEKRKAVNKMRKRI
ncbi:hypothetical protein NPIL_227431 [Nephila pilipes]|uniref:Uncharacterized protein n=1 Tax=Nephila pilipes TaxID=299642 RepID=A0A8X6PA43_NEPPI|nr:hypothetical protein NPIL_227431 [Nephila pilipes]